MINKLHKKYLFNLMITKMSHVITDFYTGFESLFYCGNISIVKVLISNNLISVENVCTTIKKYFSYKYYSPDMVLELATLLIDVGADISILQLILLKLSTCKVLGNMDCTKYLSVIHQLVNMGAVLPVDLSSICSFPNELFVEYVSLHPDIIDQNLELACVESGVLRLEYVRNILESKNIAVTDPLNLFTEAFKKNDFSLMSYCIQKIPYDPIIINKILLCLCHNTTTHYIASRNAHILAPTVAFLMLIFMYQNEQDMNNKFCEYIQKYSTDSDVIYYKQIDFDNYFTDNAGYANYIKCNNDEAVKIYNIIIHTDRVTILNDAVYEDLLLKSEFLLNMLRYDDRLVYKKID